MADGINSNYYRLNDAIIRQTERINSTNQNTASSKKEEAKVSFKELLDQNIKNTVTFSKHASVRKEQRNIEVTEDDLEKLSDACDQAQEKGINNTLIMMDDSAFIVSAANKRVITVMDKNEMKNKLFNDIEGAVFI
ncbi:TIGR02530 family flagellar biosynthesis protein [Acetobacterium woodii]|uniref:Flagellar operon protein n=1 Tax=Acetobacterium woodii (strain ATCC 29683 / DSM 1030 / JCM 2381 / KCTC 1655 / WB1) TaxID=931626 RepID=H6LE42_ACEWD|nr:TIGR02530 family flagellar biosynthesis protein [Acetobacterium woodii]AFA49275.1 flagellar operon protein [Acetobacterium woodii DSM 1030]